MRRIAFGVAVLASLAVVADDHDHDHEHEHVAPHGGTLVVFGEEAAHLELVLDAKDGKLTAYVLDGEAEKPVRIKQESITIEVTWPATKDENGNDVVKKSVLMLSAVENVLTGEKKGDTSEFAIKSKELVGATEFDGYIPKIEIKGMAFEKTKFEFPEGNEHHDHDHEDEKQK